MMDFLFSAGIPDPLLWLVVRISLDLYSIVFPTHLGMVVQGTGYAGDISKTDIR